MSLGDAYALGAFIGLIVGLALGLVDRDKPAPRFPGPRGMDD